ncbi:hypothetical protein [Sphingomonas sp.]|uniref:hypothetical protein n=1 Tax=Sphingomonas sp. TaxID=28214 RepID=UPI002DD6B702|nr:hypothetical protein [Sphingomonas sp.]
MKMILLATALAFGATAATAQDTPAPAPVAADATTPTGGYQPPAPPMAWPPPPGAQVIFQPSQSPTQAYPPPAALDSYPICKKGQYDKCRQRGG